MSSLPDYQCYINGVVKMLRNLTDHTFEENMYFVINVYHNLDRLSPSLIPTADCQLLQSAIRPRLPSRAA
jgi:hypothetical protein